MELQREAREKEAREAREKERLREMRQREVQKKEDATTDAANKNKGSPAGTAGSAASRSAEPGRRPDLSTGIYRGFWPLGNSRY